MSIYADHAATTAMSEAAIEAMTRCMRDCYGNPSSLYRIGQQAKEVLEQAREEVASVINAQPREIYFTSGGSEADNQAIRSAALAGKKNGKTHIISSAFEHHAVLHTLNTLKLEGFDVTLLPVHENGIVIPAEVEAAIRPDTCLVTIMYANNEIGTLEPIGEIGRIAGDHGIPFHTDAVQAVGCTDVDVHRDRIDLLSLSAHKIYGPKGVGALYIRRGTRIEGLIRGGAQERGLRAGTENTAGIVGLGAAIQIARTDMAARTETIRCLRDRMIRETLDTIPESWLNGPAEGRLCNNCHFSFAGVESETLLLRMDLAGIAASGGSACTSGSTEPSHVMEAIRPGGEQTGGSIRLTLGRETTEADVDETVRTMREIVADLRNLRGMLVK